jgi:aminobenzoyl-glutamate utilization protein B
MNAKYLILPFFFIIAIDCRKKRIKKSSSLKKHQQELIRANQIWGFAETAMKETKSSKVLADYAQEQGFRVTRGVKYLPLLLLNMEAAYPS